MVAAGPMRALVGGREARALEDDALSASSGMQWISFARLDGGGWVPRTSDDQQWVQWDLKDLVRLEVIQTGGNLEGGDYYVEEFVLTYDDGTGWFQHQQRFAANVDNKNVVDNVLNPPIVARKVQPGTCFWF